MCRRISGACPWQGWAGALDAIVVDLMAWRPRHAPILALRGLHVPAHGRARRGSVGRLPDHPVLLAARVGALEPGREGCGLRGWVRWLCGAQATGSVK